MPHGAHGHSHSHNHTTRNVLIIALLLALSFAAIEAIFGWYANSLALLSDAGHMATDAFSLGLAAFAAWVAAKPPSPQHSYGLGRAEVLGAWLSSIFLVVIVFAIAVEAVDRIFEPQPVSGLTVIWVAFAGVLINLLMMWFLTHGEKNLNVRAAMLHVLGDLLGSAAAMVSGIVIYYTHWTPIDPILSIFIAILILLSSLRLLKESMRILMEGVPMHIDYDGVGRDMVNVEHVRSVHDLHIWTLSSGKIAISAHVELDDMQTWKQALTKLTHLLEHDYSISHITLQPEVHTEIIKPMAKPCGH